MRKIRGTAREMGGFMMTILLASESTKSAKL